MLQLNAVLIIWLISFMRAFFVLFSSNSISIVFLETWKFIFFIAIHMILKHHDNTCMYGYIFCEYKGAFYSSIIFLFSLLIPSLKFFCTPFHNTHTIFCISINSFFHSSLKIKGSSIKNGFFFSLFIYKIYVYAYALRFFGFVKHTLKENFVYILVHLCWTNALMCFIFHQYIDKYFLKSSALSSQKKKFFLKWINSLLYTRLRFIFCSTTDHFEFQTRTENVD